MRNILLALLFLLIAMPCFANNGAYAPPAPNAQSSGSGSGTVNTGTAGQAVYYATNGTAVSGTSLISIGTNAVTIGSAVFSSASVTASNLFSYTPTTNLYNPQIPYFTAESGSNATGLLNQYSANNDAALLPHFRKCLALVKYGTGRCRVMLIGDSTTFGYGSQGVGSDVKTYSWPAYLAKALSSQFGVPADYDSFIGSGAGTQSDIGHDPRLSVTGSTITSTAISYGGNLFEMPGSAGTLTFAPIHPFNTVKFWYVTNPSSLGTIGMQVDNGSVTSVSENATASTTSTTLSTTLGKHTATFSYVSGGNVYAMGYEFYDTNHPSISVMNNGWFGSAVTDWYSSSTPGWGPMNAATALGGDLTIINLDLNDANHGTAIATYKADLQTIITTVQAAGSDVVLMTSTHATSTGYTDASVAPYVQAVYQVAATNNLPVIDNWARQVSSSFASANGWIYSDGTHTTGPGYADVAQTVAQFLGSVIAGGAGNGPAHFDSSAQNDVNFLSMSSSNTGVAPSLSVFGKDTNIGLSLLPQGTGGVGIGTTTSQSELDVYGPIRTLGYTVATLPTGVAGMRAYVTDQTTACPVVGGSLTGSGAITCPVFYNGSAWVGD